MLTIDWVPEPDLGPAQVLIVRKGTRLCSVRALDASRMNRGSLKGDDKIYASELTPGEDMCAPLRVQ